ncbi:MAG: phenylalanine--tRNA ligase subunit alpha [Acidimicrobiia bacterium]|nr:phenylalanine--tRNA ligase subunit alpha [Acidimicrobiia bacterium]
MDALDALQAEAPGRIEGAGSLDDLKAVEAELVGRSSVIAEMRRGLGSLPPDERPVVGQAVNRVATEVAARIAARREVLELEAENRLLLDDAVDVTLPGRRIAGGAPHLITSTIDEIIDIFVSLGYRVADGPEVETGWYNFDALNTPPDHPARAESDTLYVEFGDESDEMLLRTQTSPMQARYMQQHEPPVYVVVPGRVYRSDTLDPTHSPVFHQMEGLAVDEDITFGDLKGTLGHFAREFFGSDTKTRFLPHFFLFTEPSAEMYVSCFACDGSGCRVCGGPGWIEILGCGMVDPNVFDAVEYDASAVTGFAFGMGIERIAMSRHGLTHIKHLFENDVRVLGQFG